jgi:hypothetical protein
VCRQLAADGAAEVGCRAGKLGLRLDVDGFDSPQRIDPVSGRSRTRCAGMCVVDEQSYMSSAAFAFR